MIRNQPKTMLEGIYIGAPVWCPWRETNGLMPLGSITGFIWDTDDNGVVIEFDDHDFISRFFVPWSEFTEDTWQPTQTGGLFTLSKLTLLRVIPKGPTPWRVAATHVGLWDVEQVIVRKRRKIPIWSEKYVAR